MIGIERDAHLRKISECHPNPFRVDTATPFVDHQRVAQFVPPNSRHDGAVATVSFMARFARASSSSARHQDRTMELSRMSPVKTDVPHGRYRSARTGRSARDGVDVRGCGETRVAPGPGHRPPRAPSGDGPAVAGDGQALASHDPFQKPGQVGLGLVGADVLHLNPLQTRKSDQSKSVSRSPSTPSGEARVQGVGEVRRRRRRPPGRLSTDPGVDPDHPEAVDGGPDCPGGPVARTVAARLAIAKMHDRGCPNQLRGRAGNGPVPYKRIRMPGTRGWRAAETSGCRICIFLV